MINLADIIDDYPKPVITMRMVHEMSRMTTLDEIAEYLRDYTMAEVQALLDSLIRPT